MCHIFTSDDDAPEAAPEVHFKATATAEKLITTDSVGITSTGGFNSKSYWDTWSKARSCFVVEFGQSKHSWKLKNYERFRETQLSNFTSTST